MHCKWETKVKPFNCLWLVLSFSLATSIFWCNQSFCEATNATTTMLTLFLLYQFWLAQICISHKPHSNRDETYDLQITLPRTRILPVFFFYTSGTPHARHIRARFELWGKPFRSSLLASFFFFFLLVLL